MEVIDDKMQDHLFQIADSLRFAELSGDFNPLHIDSLHARRTLFGRPVVHGIHLVLWSLNSLVTKQVLLSGLSATFSSHVAIGEKVRCAIQHEDADTMAIVLKSQGIDCSTIRLTFECPYNSGTPVRDDRAERGPCRDMSPEAIPSAFGRTELYLESERLDSLFPGLLEKFAPRQIAALLASTRVVGMECPGLYSIYSNLKIDFHAGNSVRDTVVDWRVARFDARFNKLILRMSAPDLSAEITAFFRPRPQEQPSFLEIRKQVPPSRYLDQKVLVVGGSRGIGEVCAKILAAGGADVRLTYHQGAEDASRVVNDINLCGGTAQAGQLDVLNEPTDLGAVLGEWFPSHVYYFATPPIFAGRGSLFSHDLFQRFYQMYVQGFLNVYSGLRRISKAHLNIYYPSSVAVTEAPFGMGEYAAAKSAGETVCRFLTKIDSNVSITVERLPRLPTDQTGNLLGVRGADILSTLLLSLDSPESRAVF